MHIIYICIDQKRSRQIFQYQKEKQSRAPLSFSCEVFEHLVQNFVLYQEDMFLDTVFCNPSMIMLVKLGYKSNTASNTFPDILFSNSRYFFCSGLIIYFHVWKRKNAPDIKTIQLKKADIPTGKH